MRLGHQNGKHTCKCKESVLTLDPQTDIVKF